MATVTITITDKKKGQSVKFASDPPFPRPAAEDHTMTGAQQMGLYLMEKISEACK